MTSLRRNGSQGVAVILGINTWISLNTCQSTPCVIPDSIRGISKSKMQNHWSKSKASMIVSISSAYDKSRCKKEEKLFAPDISTDLFYGRDDFNCFTCLVKDKSRSQTILVSPMQLREEKRFPEDVTLHCFPR